MMNRQNQKGGDGSTNIQAENMILQVGIDEKRAREIYQEMNLQLKKDYSEEALKIASARVTEFENRLMPKMESVEGALQAFADPSFQILLVEAQKTAASTERAADYDLLSELLIHRFQKGENRFVRAGISRAVEIVDEISDDALLGLTAFHAINTFMPVTGDIFQGLDVLNDLYGKILYGDLPSGSDWLDHLDILDAIRLSSFGQLMKVEQYYPEQLPGYVDVGIKKNSANFTKALDIITANDLPRDILINHALNPDYERIPTPHKKQINTMNLVHQIFNNGRIHTLNTPLSENQKEAISSIYDLYDNDTSVRSANIRTFMDNWDKRRNLRIFKSWWNKLNVGIKLTSVGRVLAHSNAQRCDGNIPPLD